MRGFSHFIALCALVISSNVYALTYPLTDSQVVGGVTTVTAKHEDTFAQLGRQYNIGADALERANPGLDIWIPGEGTAITIPSAFVLPDNTRKGIVVNLPELRLYYFNPEVGEVSTFPLGIGKDGWSTPTNEIARVTEKTANPTWVVPTSILAEHAELGTPIPGLVDGRHVPPGDFNPLGKYRLRLSIPSILLHGTNAPIGVGRQVTHGCMRLFPEDIESLFNMVSVGTPVYILNDPIKMGWKGDELYLEVHPSLSSHPLTVEQRKVLLVDKLHTALQDKNATVNWSLVYKVVQQQSGVATLIATL
ncbi:MAG TPA: L,D-transpeptidase family protein [Gammaproteobacteria bacterium]|nr:L,D-transpeptidase family protein [Gammaproteobacteria bacterium]